MAKSAGALYLARETLSFSSRHPGSPTTPPDWKAFHENCASVLKLAESGKIRAASPVIAGGIAAALTKMAFGNRVGAAIDTGALPLIRNPAIFAAAPSNQTNSLFTPLYGSLLLEVAAPVTGLSALASGTSTANWVVLGQTLADPAILVGKIRIPLDDAQAAWGKTARRAYSRRFPAWLLANELPQWAKGPGAGSDASAISAKRAPVARKGPTTLPAGAKPLVVLPVFPGNELRI